MILQLGVKPSWFNTSSTCIDKRPHSIPGRTSSSKDLRSFMIDFPPIGDPAVLEMFLKVLEPYRSEGCVSLLFLLHKTFCMPFHVNDVFSLFFFW